MELRTDSVRGDAVDGGGAPQRATITERILFISDDEQMRALLCELLVAHGCKPVRGLDSFTALASIDRLANCDVAIVDTSVSYESAMRVFRKLKGSGNPSVVVIAAKNHCRTDINRAVEGDLLLAKPFDPRELVFIIRGMLRGRGRGAPQTRELLSVGPITLHPLLNTATVAAREVDLTGVETRVLEELLVNASNPVSRDRLTRCGSGRKWSPFDRSVDTHIKRLRRKLGDDRLGRTPIRTIRGVGYLLLAQWEPRA